MRNYARAVALGVLMACGAVLLDAAIINWPSACEQSGNVIWQWIWDCPDVPSGGGSSGGW